MELIQSCYLIKVFLINHKFLCSFDALTQPIGALKKKQCYFQAITHKVHMFI